MQDVIPGAMKEKRFRESQLPPSNSAGVRPVAQDLGLITTAVRSPESNGNSKASAVLALKQDHGIHQVLGSESAQIKTEKLHIMAFSFDGLRYHFSHQLAMKNNGQY